MEVPPEGFPHADSRASVEVFTAAVAFMVAAVVTAAVTVDCIQFL